MTKRFLLTALLVTTLSFAQQTSNYQQGLQFLSQKDTSKAKECFLKSAKSDRDPKAYYELAKIQYSHKEIYKECWKGLDFIVEAESLEPMNAEYKYLKGIILERLYYHSIFFKDARLRARIAHEEAVEIDSTLERAWFELGRLYKEDFEKYINSQSDMSPESYFAHKQKTDKVKLSMRRSILKEETQDRYLASLPKATLKYDKEVQKDYVKSETAFLKSFDLSRREESLDGLIELSIINKLYENGINLLEKYIKVYENKNKYYGYLGMLYYLMGEIEKSVVSYNKYLELLTPKEYEAVTKLSLLKVLDTAAINDLESKEDEYVKNKLIKSLAIQDPLFLTNYNERLLEHYTRFVYSNLFFSVKRIGLEGWNTDRGEVVLRYGFPGKTIRLRGDMYLHETETLYYKDKTFAFYDAFRKGNFVFNIPEQTAGTSRHPIYSQSINETEDSMIVYYRVSKPQTYEPKLSGPELQIPICFYQLKSLQPNRTDVYASFLINPKDSILEKKYFDDGYRTGLFFFDKDNNKLVEKTNNNKGLLSDKNFFINSYSISAMPNKGTLAFELLRNRDRGSFSRREAYNIKSFTEKDLSISDIILAFHVDGENSNGGSIKRNDIAIQPNPANDFWKGAPLFVYYELYGLTVKDNSTSFEQNLKIEKKEEGVLKEISQNLLSVIGLDNKENKIELITNYRTNETNPQLYFQIDMSNYEKGNYLFTITVKDKFSGKSVSSSSEIFWSN